MTSSHSQDELTAIQGVVDRVSSYQDGAPESTVAQELRSGLTEAGLDLPEAEVAQLADAIEEKHGAVDAASVLG